MVTVPNIISDIMPDHWGTTIRVQWLAILTRDRSKFRVIFSITYHITTNQLIIYITSKNILLFGKLLFPHLVKKYLAFLELWSSLPYSEDPQDFSMFCPRLMYCTSPDNFVKTNLIIICSSSCKWSLFFWFSLISSASICLLRCSCSTDTNNIRNIRFRQQPYDWCCVLRHVDGISHTELKRVI